MASRYGRRLFSTTASHANAGAQSATQHARMNPIFDRRARVEGRRAKRVARFAELDGNTALDPTTSEALSAGDMSGEPAPKAPRMPKRKAAVLFGYSGAGFSGLQNQPVETGVVTIENVLFDALVKAGAVSADNADDPFKVNFQRAARTDAGVSALGNLLSANLIITDPNLVSKVNHHLPKTIRVWDIVRSMGSFNAHTQCQARRYSYFFPTHILRPPSPGTALHAAINGLLTPPSSEPWFKVEPPNDAGRFDYRVSDDTLERLRNLGSSFVGRRKYHNFTPELLPGDPTTNRELYSIDFSEPFMKGGIEWVKISLYGQSFILHQIRKMVGALFLFTRTQTPPVVLRALMDRRSPGRTHVPRAPAAGLMLDHAVFESYNNKVVKEKSSNKVVTGGIRFGQYTAQMEEMRETTIWPGLLESEPAYADWIHVVDHYDGQDLCYLGPQAGAFPDDPAPLTLDTTGCPPLNSNIEGTQPQFPRMSSEMEVLQGPGARVRFTYSELGSATLPTYGPSTGWGERRFMDHYADARWRGQRGQPKPAGEEAAAEARDGVA